MRVVTFFMCLCFLLLKGDTAAYAGTFHHDHCYAIAQHIADIQQVNLDNTDQYRFVLVDPDRGIELEYTFCDDIEDDDSNNFPGGRYKLPSRSHPVYSYLFVLNHRGNSFKARPFFFGQVSDKCILQRVLRI